MHERFENDDHNASFPGFVGAADVLPQSHSCSNFKKWPGRHKLDRPPTQNPIVELLTECDGQTPPFRAARVSISKAAELSNRRATTGRTESRSLSSCRSFGNTLLPTLRAQYQLRGD